MKRLASPITDLKPEYEVVVIGSGYGGGIAASRMARCGRKVCLLEKGKEFLPGEFPSTKVEAAGEIQVAAGGKHEGSKTGLYDFVVGEEISVLKGCGLGGTSLINANVSIEADERVFDDPVWPAAINENNRQALREGIEQARRMLKPNPYPEGENGYPLLDKTQGMRASAAQMNEEFRLLDINVTFEDKVNDVGVEQKRCINCGDCVTGCNHEAKNTVQMNYLPDAKNHGAEIFTQIGVDHIERAGDHWLIHFDLLDAGREKFDAPPLFIRAKAVFLCAGSLGSTEILLRSAARGLPLSSMLGKRFTGNGDVLGFGYNNDRRIHAMGLGDRAKPPEVADVGPCITSVIDTRKGANWKEGMTLEEGSIPGPIAGIVSKALGPAADLLGKDTDSGDSWSERWRRIKGFFGGADAGANDNSQVYLVMTHDDSNGEMKLNGAGVEIDWPKVGEQEIFKKVNGKLEEATEALGGTYIKNPVWSKAFGHDLITVHPLGGCVMGEDAASGVVDHKGQVFAGKAGDERYPGLYVLDGAILPRSVGTNPLLTISGLAERGCKIIAGEMGRSLDYAFQEVPPHPSEEEPVGVQFTESMTGFFSLAEKDDYEQGHDQGKAAGSDFRFILTIQTQDIDSFVADPQHEAGMAGTVTASALSDDPLSISDGVFNLFVDVEGEKDRKQMKYAMRMHDTGGRVFYFKGFKDIHDDFGFDVWADTTVLYITIFDGADDSAPVLGKGKLKIEVADFKDQLKTMKAVHAGSKIEGLKAVAKFGKLFMGKLWETYGING